MENTYEYTVVQHGIEWIDEFNQMVLDHRKDGWEECGQVDIDSSHPIPILRIPMRKELIS